MLRARTTSGKAGSCRLGNLTVDDDVLLDEDAQVRLYGSVRSSEKGQVVTCDARVRDGMEVEDGNACAMRRREGFRSDASGNEATYLSMHSDT